MKAELRLAGDSAAEAYPMLWDWLVHEEGLRGRVEWSSGTPGDTGLGAQDWITVALGAGGAGTVLAASLGRWLGRAQRPGLKLKVTRRRAESLEEIEVEVGRLDEETRDLLAGLLGPAERDPDPAGGAGDGGVPDGR
uniref:effector-associated constant component EACC1 n=1 Tax=Amycolatopsis sp. CA-096443 TaxID=3239919 RepID=UPI003F49B357